ncbi:unnamed protein product [Mesocestoides corti]|uniref:DZANK-type domain-containing protein n=1 Tax=Mesocestoides corti TaxID=53468 RepID=A0A0R3U934_MESCO|nr:unnamed protein product [Mesocestoides corti]
MPRPPTVVCYICHREFGTASIGIHEKSCLKKWHDENNKLPKSERQPEPVKPSGFPGDPASSGAAGGFEDNRTTKTTGNDPNIEAYNAAAAQTNLVACAKCGRKFAADRVKAHQAHCKPPPPKRHTYEARKPDVDLKLLQTPLSGKSNVPGPGPSTGGLIACKVCGRTFAPDRIERHQAGCRATPVKQQASTSKTAGRRRTITSIVRPQVEPSCPGCQAKVGVGDKFCPQCGNPIPLMCLQCGMTFADGARFCSNCGQPAQANRNNLKVRKKPFSVLYHLLSRSRSAHNHPTARGFNLGVRLAAVLHEKRGLRKMFARDQPKGQDGLVEIPPKDCVAVYKVEGPGTTVQS